jgi:hypothetical protein
MLKPTTTQRLESEGIEAVVDVNGLESGGPLNID